MMTLMTLTTHSHAHYHNEILTSLHSLVLGACSPCLVGSSLSDPPARVGHELGAAVVESGALFSLAHGLSRNPKIDFGPLSRCPCGPQLLTAVAVITNVV